MARLNRTAKPRSDDRYQLYIVIAIWLVSLLPGLIVSIRKGDPLYASIIVMVIQLLASFGSITLFGVIAQLVCYHYVKSIEVHDRMMDGLFYGFHAGIVIWILYAFYHILFGRKIIGDVNMLVGFFGTMCITSCIIGIIIGFLVGRYRDAKANAL
ncbi:hypothetical protein [Desulfovibrio inopinatus]|uniref:hypothetical protein n=1 Tax=Desulfovibrio inopinatus TaxID=102109 RepID=UPI0004058BB5|nr:hypothetical protein [Desulfovibrio inopinatus]